MSTPNGDARDKERDGGDAYSPNPSEASPSKRARVESDGHDSNSTASASLPSLAISIVNVEPLDEFIREVADFVHHTIVNRPTNLKNAVVEVEAKIGLMKERHSGKRLNLPILTETILKPDTSDVIFESDMSQNQHRHYNKILNGLEETYLRDRRGSPFRHQHLRLVDNFYADGGNSKDDKIRVTRDEKTGEVKECLQKRRLKSINIYSPKRSVDWRVSVNLEIPVTHPVGSPTYQRKKDRMSYMHEEFRIDLTQVTSTTSGGEQSMSHELELEFARPDFLLATALRRGELGPEGDAFEELIRVFVNNARILARNAGQW